jgi:hypothetical protein
MANINGWGRSTWGADAWGEASPVILTGLDATSSLGTASNQTNNNLSVSLGSSTGELGSVDARIVFSITITGESATGQVGSVDFDAEANVTLPTLVSSVGTPSVDTIGNGWGRSTWGSGPFGLPVSQTRTVTVAGFGMTSALGTTIAFTTVDINVTGFPITSALGTLSSITGTANIFPTGLEGTSVLGTVAAQASAVAGLPGLTSSVGDVSVVASGEAVITLTGFAITSNLGTVTTESDNRFGVLGLSAIVSIPATIAVDAEANVTITGISATSELSNLNVWALIDESQTPNWTDVAA